MSKVAVIPAVQRTKVVRVEPPKVALELTPSEAYHLYALMSCGVLVSSLRRLGLERLQEQLSRTFFPGSGIGSALDLGSWRPAEIGFGEQRPLDLHACMAFGRTVSELERCDA